MSYSGIPTGVEQLLDANVPLDVATKYTIMSPATWLKYENLVTGISSDKTQLPRPRALENMEFTTKPRPSAGVSFSAVPDAPQQRNRVRFQTCGRIRQNDGR